MQDSKLDTNSKESKGCFVHLVLNDVGVEG